MHFPKVASEEKSRKRKERSKRGERSKKRKESTHLPKANALDLSTVIERYIDSQRIY